MTTKQTTFLREIAYKHHPGYMNTDILFQRQQLVIVNSYPKSVDVENITEIALAYRGGYNFVDLKSQDFDDIDKSDSKTGTINIVSRKVEIGGIANKIGALRLSIWNPILDVVDFMFLPYASWKHGYANKCYGKNTEGKLRLQMTWDPKKNSYNRFEIFRLMDFEELATMTEEKFYLLHPELESFRQIELNISQPIFDLLTLPKTDPNLQTTSLYSLESDQQQIQDPADIQPISLSEIS